jgi:type IV pilus assembly protein PilC
LRKYPGVFDALYCAIVAAGEASATLPAMFTRLSEMLAKRRRIRNQLVGSLIYPALLIGLCVGIMGVMLGFVIPRFGQMFETLGVPLPTSTESMLAASAAIRAHWYVPVLGLLAAGGASVGLWRNRRGRQWLSDLRLRIPLYGRLASRLILAQVLRVLGTLTATQVNLLESMDLARRVTGNRRYRTMLDAMEQAVTSGRPLAGALEASGLATPAICQAIQTGEESGNLGGAISFAADVLDEENVEWVNALTRLVEPVILLVMGAIVGGVAISLFLPLFDMTSAVQ